MTEMSPIPAGLSLTDFCKQQEAFETPRWAIESILDVELTTPRILDACAGTGIIPAVCEDRGLEVTAFDNVDWSRIMPDVMKWKGTIFTADFFSYMANLEQATVVMNPPFSEAERFVDHARFLGARKIICFQRQAWRESKGRRTWWEEKPPARVWVCGERATCWRFDLLDCQHQDGIAACPNAKRKGKRHETQGCCHCLGSVPGSTAWYVWERGHRGAEVTSAIYPAAEVPVP